MLERRYIPETENRLVILHALEKLGPITEMQLLRFLTELDLMNYFDMKLNLCDMLDRGKLAEEPHPLGALLCITAEGRQLLTDFEKRIPASRREMIDQSTTVWRAAFRREQQTLADVFPLSDGSSCIRLRLLENRSAILDAMITVQEAKPQHQIQQKWLQCSGDLYSAITDSLAQGFLGEMPQEDLPPNTAVQQMENTDWLLSMADEPAHPRMTLMMALPDEAMARHYALRWPAQCQAIGKVICEALEES
ncbi:MAG: DUF4364 family protein [Clostridia bacterium]|nr:DUF4364 family protein [Clostridia bacterium]